MEGGASSRGFQGRMGVRSELSQRVTPSSWLRWGIPLDFTGFMGGGGTVFFTAQALEGGKQVQGKSEDHPSDPCAPRVLAELCPQPQAAS